MSDIRTAIASLDALRAFAARSGDRQLKELLEDAALLLHARASALQPGPPRS